MSGNLRRLIIVILVFLLVIFGFIWLVRKLTNRGEQAPIVHKVKLIDLADTNTTVKMVINGKIVGNDEHDEVHITVGRNSRVMDIVKGYEGTIVNTDTFANNESAYWVFLSALEDAEFTQARRVSAAIIPEGTCPTGKRFWYQIIHNDEELQSLWSTSCSGTKGTFAGSSNTVQWLFENQIPNYDDRTNDLDI